MKPYGKFRQIPCPDLVDLQEMAAQSGTGSLRGKGGDYRGQIKPKNRKATRRHQKHRTRWAVKQEIRAWLFEN